MIAQATDRKSLNLESLEASVVSRYETLQHVELPAKQLAMEGDTICLADRGRFELTDHAVMCLASEFGITKSMLDRLEAVERRALVRFILDHRRDRYADQVQFRSIILDGRVLSCGRSTPFWVPPDRVVATVIDATQQTAEEVAVHASLRDHELEIRMTASTKRVEPRRGDIVRGGVRFFHSITGQEATRVDCFLYRLVCKNGMLAPVSMARATQLPNGQGNQPNRERKAAATDLRIRRCDSLLIQVGKLVREAWAQVGTKLHALEELAKTPFDSGLLEKNQRIFSLSDRLQQDIWRALDADELDVPSPPTVYDVINAMSRVGTWGNGDEKHPLSDRQLLTLMRAAGEFAAWVAKEKCAKCGRYMDGGAR